MRNADDGYQLPSCRRPTHFVSLTRGWKEQTEIYRSLRHLGIESFDIVEHNTRGIPECYNEFLTRFSGQDVLLVFVHDDVSLNDTFVREKLTEVSGWFNIIGVAGAAEFRDVGQQRLSWRFASNEQHLSGNVHHEPNGWSGFWARFGTAPQECVTLDGLFLCIDMLSVSDLRFDERFRFHFYDLDLCVMAAQRKLVAGTADIMLSHRSLGDITTDSYQEGTRIFREKWKTPVSMSVFPGSTRE